MDSVEARSVAQDVIHSILSDRQRKKFIEDDPLVVPLHLTARLYENLLGRTMSRRRIGSQPIDRRVMKLLHRLVKLVDDDIFIAATVSDDGIILRISGNIETDRIIPRDLL